MIMMMPMCLRAIPCLRTNAFCVCRRHSTSVCRGFRHTPPFAFFVAARRVVPRTWCNASYSTALLGRRPHTSLSSTNNCDSYSPELRAFTVLHIEGEDVRVGASAFGVGCALGEVIWPTSGCVGWQTPGFGSKWGRLQERTFLGVCVCGGGEAMRPCRPGQCRHAAKLWWPCKSAVRPRTPCSAAVHTGYLRLGDRMCRVSGAVQPRHRCQRKWSGYVNPKACVPRPLGYRVC